MLGQQNESIRIYMISCQANGQQLRRQDCCLSQESTFAQFSLTPAASKIPRMPGSSTVHRQNY